MKKISILITLSFLTLANLLGCSTDNPIQTDQRENGVGENNNENDNNEIDEDSSKIEYSPIYFKYDEGAQETVNVYVHVYDSLYAMFRVVHEVNSKKFKNLWRIKRSYMNVLEEGKMVEKYPILTAGENEFVWYADRDGVVDATGGFHGNERIDIDPNYGSIEFFADNKMLDLSDVIPLTAVDSFHYIQLSTMHQTGTGGLVGSSTYVPVSGNPLECYHEKKTVFDKGGYVTYNKLEWADNNTTVLRCYFGLICVTPEISKEGYSEDGSHVIFNDDGGMELVTEGSKIVMLNKDLNLKVTCDSHLNKPEGYTTTTMIWDRNVYHKYYNRVGGGGVTIKTKKGDIWKAVASIHFENLK
ncbi:MAG TPA: hypothetical protein VK084_07555 [Chitinophagaceae bacterium]|nr:hypothetical protein [Chitinophagaceae bacterium]